MNTRSSKLSLAAILDTSIGRLHVFATVIMTVHLQPPMEFAVRQPMKLDSGDTFPDLTLRDLDDNDVTIPEVFGDGWGIVLMYRGHW